MIVDEYFLKGIDLIKQRSFVPTAVASTFFLYSGQLFLGQSLGHFSLLLSKSDGVVAILLKFEFRYRPTVHTFPALFGALVWAVAPLIVLVNDLLG